MEQPITKTSIKAFLSSPVSRKRLKLAISRVKYKNARAAFLRNSSGKSFACVRVEDGQLTIKTRKGVNIANNFKEVLQSMKN